jgi:hypothetical protein
LVEACRGGLGHVESLRPKITALVQRLLQKAEF